MRLASCTSLNERCWGTLVSFDAMKKGQPPIGPIDSAWLEGLLPFAPLFNCLRSWWALESRFIEGLFLLPSGLRRPERSRFPWLVFGLALHRNDAVGVDSCFAFAFGDALVAVFEAVEAGAEGTVAGNQCPLDWTSFGLELLREA